MRSRGFLLVLSALVVLLTWYLLGGRNLVANFRAHSPGLYPYRQFGIRLPILLWLGLILIPLGVGVLLADLIDWIKGSEG
jgi:hypothetical protein